MSRRTAVLGLLMVAVVACATPGAPSVVPANTPPAGWTEHHGDDPPFAIALPLAWAPEPVKTNDPNETPNPEAVAKGYSTVPIVEVFRASSAGGEGSLTISTRALKLEAVLKEWQSAGYELGEVEFRNVSLPGGSAMVATYVWFGQLFTTYVFPVGDGVVELGFLHILPSSALDVPPVWEEIAKTVNPSGASLP